MQQRAVVKDEVSDAYLLAQRWTVRALLESFVGVIDVHVLRVMAS